jgi:hypothetical protein
MERQRSCREERSSHDQSKKLGISCHVVLSLSGDDQTQRDMPPCVSPLIWINRHQLQMRPRNGTEALPSWDGIGVV